MLFAEVLEFVSVALILATLITQVLIPLFRGTRFFPIFRRERVLAERLAVAEEDLQAAELERATRDVERRTRGVREKNGTPTPVIPISEDDPLAPKVHTDASGEVNDETPASETKV